jgi:hypothetical protein
MADYTIPNLTTAVVGFASTAAFKSDFISQSIITENLTFHLDSSFDNSYSGTGSSWIDLTSNQNNATLIGNYSYSDYSLIFANGGYAVIPDKSTFDISDDFAIETFIYMTETPNAVFPSALVSSWADTGNIDNKFILFVNSSGTLALQINGESNSWTHPGTINLNQWYHIAVSRVNGVINMYINGVSGGNISYPSSITPTLDIAIGSYSAAFGSYSFQGKIPMVRFYNGRGLTSDEVYKNSRTITINASNGTVSVGNISFDNFNETRPGWLTGRRPVNGQVFPRGVYNK